MGGENLRYMVSVMPRTAGDSHIYTTSFLWEKFDADNFFFFGLFLELPVSKDKSEQDLGDVVVFDMLVAMDTG